MVDEGNFLAPEHFPREITGFENTYPIRSLAEVVEETERRTISECLNMMDGNKSETAKHLGISRTSLYEKMNKYRL
jgi:transcriptional regulator with PAS, ATPase and Fis domain